MDKEISRQDKTQMGSIQSFTTKDNRDYDGTWIGPFMFDNSEGMCMEAVKFMNRDIVIESVLDSILRYGYFKNILC